MLEGGKGWRTGCKSTFRQVNAQASHHGRASLSKSRPIGQQVYNQPSRQSTIDFRHRHLTGPSGFTAGGLLPLSADISPRLPAHFESSFLTFRIASSLQTGVSRSDSRSSNLPITATANLSDAAAILKAHSVTGNFRLNLSKQLCGAAQLAVLLSS